MNLLDVKVVEELKKKAEIDNTTHNPLKTF